MTYHMTECPLCDCSDGHRDDCPNQEPANLDVCQECGAVLWRSLGHYQFCSMMQLSERNGHVTEPETKPISDLEIRRRNSVLSLRGKINRWREAHWLPLLEGDSNA